MSFLYTSTPTVLDWCKDFAKNSVSSSVGHYKKRNQFDKDKIGRDIEIGKLGEFAAFVYLNSMGVETTRPDLKIYEIKRKTFDLDLKSLNFNFHVKSATQYEKIPLSWTFQYGNEELGHFDPVLKTKNTKDIVIFCEILQTKIQIKGCLSTKNIIEMNLLKDPKIERLKGQKLCVYYDDIKNLGDSVLWSLGIPVEKPNS